ncbi:putative fructosyl amino acid oxidase [Thelonectria olida]|uniref:Fructosyl amino acid oxidase n=1 Tax=Thelonectria olida TaxID=1576542 RepID=A0A9P8WFJ5_9HYPO|nr:putative fructosyl amino acid oxidase [Thelonectria olida]
MTTYHLPSKNEPIIIVGAGVFGLGLAYELAAVRGYTNITVLDRHLPPVVDGSSVDVSRIIRTEYADPVYATLAAEAILGWRGPKYSPFYYESGYVMLAEDEDNHYFAGCKNQREAGKREGRGEPVQEFTAAEADVAVKKLYPGVQAKLAGLVAMHNRVGGWANAAGAVHSLAQSCGIAGVSFVTGRRGTVVRLKRDGSQVSGVCVASGEELPAAQVVLATGAWTNGLVEGVDHTTIASGQPVGFVQLTAAEAATLQPSPVLINMSTGVFGFPPTPETHLLKIARNGHGYATSCQTTADENGRHRVISSPNRDGNNASSGFLPQDADEALREGLRRFFPAFADRPWSSKRLCWYMDTPKGDFIVDHHPQIKGLFIATGGSGHGFKFLPILGKYVADCFESKAPLALRQKWQLQPSTGAEETVNMVVDGSRAGPPLRVLTAYEQSKL